MYRAFLAGILLLVGAGAFFALRTTPQADPPPAEDLLTFYVRMGLQAKGVESWDGSVTATGGEIVAVEGHQFFAEDSVQGTNWKASTRDDQIRGFARVNYNEMSPAELPPAVINPTGIYVTVRPSGNARLNVRTAQGEFQFAAQEISLAPKPFLDGKVTVQWAPTVSKLTTEEFEDDEAAIVALPGGGLAVAWMAYKDRADRVFVRDYEGGRWGAVQEATPSPGDLFRCSLAVDSDGALWAFWSERDDIRWHIKGRRRVNGAWGETVTVSGDGTNTFHRAAASPDGVVHVVWQSFRGPAGAAQSDIFLRSFRNGKWEGEQRMSDSPANDWEPDVAGGPKGTAYVVWDSYHKGDYDIYFRAVEQGRPQQLQPLTSSARFQAHASVAVDAEGRPWVAWDESGANWGKDVAYLITPSYGIPLHQERSLRLARWDGKRWTTPAVELEPWYPYQLFPNMENPRIAFDGDGTLTLVLRNWRRAESHGVGSPQGWENYLTRFDGRDWTRPVPLAHSRGHIEKRGALARDSRGHVWAAWMADNREYPASIPQNAEIYTAKLGKSGKAPVYSSSAFKPFEDPFAEAVPIHPLEKRNVAAVRDYTIRAGDRQYKIYRGDMHRHTDVSQDFKYDGSLIEVYRYALDAAAFDYIVPTDHQLGFDQEFTWWQDEKLKDLFHVAGTFTPLFGYERSVPYPNGHRNVIFPKRGTRTLPIPREEITGEAGAGRLYAYLKENNGISMPHSSGTAQGTNWRDNDPEVEPLIEIYQGYRASYEYIGAPLAASPQRQREQRSGFAPLGYYWKALAKGHKLGVQASSDHWSTHTSYACILSETFDREGMFQALKKRHAYAATDNIVLDFQAESGGKSYIMGDIITGARSTPKFRVRAIGTDDIVQVVIVKNQGFAYVGNPNSKEVNFEFSDTDFKPGKNWYYVRVVQGDRQVAWGSPIWVE